MRVLLSTIGSRGDVQPIVALALALKALDVEVRACLPPDFREWIEGLGIPVIPIGPELRGTGKSNPSGARLTPEQGRRMMEESVATQFETIASAAQGCGAILGATALQIAAPSIAERMGIPYVFAAYCPVVLPSRHHAPPVLTALGDKPNDASADYAAPDYGMLWAQDAQRWNTMWSGMLNSHRTALGLARIDDMRSYIHTQRPWLAADPALAPWPDPADETVFQTGAWILPDERRLPEELERFLDAGTPPIYFGFGSISAPGGLARVMIETARSLGRRAVVSRGWAELALVDEQPDCLSIGDINHQALFKRVAAVVHHGGGGTTTAAARAGAPQVVIPQHYDQHYWAQRVQQLGIGIAHAPGTSTQESLTRALIGALEPDVAKRARSIAARVRADGAHVAAQALGKL
jgi:vancomycin aglycone glucosyltransferase